jgi:hypothetical protein
MDLKEILLKEYISLKEAIIIGDRSRYGSSLEELNLILDFCGSIERVGIIRTEGLLENLKRNPACDEEILLKIKAITKVNELTRNL